MSDILQTQEVGSLAKPDWRVAPIRGDLITLDHVRQAASWADKFGEDVVEVEDTFCQLRSEQLEEGKLSSASKQVIKALSARYSIRLQELAGLDIIYDGEQDRAEMYQHAVAHTNGFEWAGRVRAFDNNSFRKAVCTGEVGISEPWHTSEVQRLQHITDKTIKVPITGAYTIADWSYDAHYNDRETFVKDIAKNVIRPNIESLLEQGVEWIQIDEPAAGTKPYETKLLVDSYNVSTAGLLGKFSIHICFSNYETLFPAVAELENCSQFSLEFANRDPRTLGTNAAQRPALEVLKLFSKHTPEAAIGLGVASVHDNEVESPQLVRDRILRAVDIIGDPAKINPSPDCGLRTRSWEVALSKLRTTTEGTLLARDQLS